jgi:hypothetical protein
MGDRQLISRTEPPHFHSLAIDPNAVRAPQIPHDDFPIVLRHAAMTPGNADGIEPGVTLGMTAHHDHRSVKRDVGTFTKCDEAGWHPNNS